METTDTTSFPEFSQQWDIFCRVIDNFGDVGVCWRLASDLAGRGQQVRLWLDDASALDWMAPQGCKGVEIRAWGSALLPDAPPSDVLIEAFGCEIAPNFIATNVEQIRARGQKDPKKPKKPKKQSPVWINLEYLSAEPYVERCHTLPSPVQQGLATGWTKWFFYPGFTPATGGLLREPDLLQRQALFDVSAWRTAHSSKDTPPDTWWISLFCYEPPALAAFLAQCQQTASHSTQLWVTPGRASMAVKALQPLPSLPEQLSISYLPQVTQAAFDEMLWACDLNFVRGEDSLVRAIWAGKPFIWQIYPQEDNAHHAKLHAFLDWLQAPASLREFHGVWNGVMGESIGVDVPLALPELTTHTLKEWADCVQAARTKLLAQSDLLSELMGFCSRKR